MINFNKQLLFKDVLLNRSINNFSINSKLVCEDNNCLDDMIRKHTYLNNFRNKNIPLLTESLFFKLEVLKELKNVEIKDFRNISFEEYNTILFYKKNKPFKVVELDKNIGVGIISNDLYTELTLELLKEVNTYKEVLDFEISGIKNEINEALEKICIEDCISEKILKFLWVEKVKIGTIRILPKLHKKKFSVRPIISYKNHPTDKLCVLLDFILRPFVIKADSYIKDSQDLILKTMNKSFPPDSKLFSCDFESLYTNIDHCECLDMLCGFMSDKLNVTEIKITGFRVILNLILKYNYFKFNNKNYLQIKGIAMGSKVGPSIANIFVRCLEDKWLNIYKPLHFSRFIDDIFCILKNMNEIDSLKCAFGSLKLNIISNDMVNFLDLNIKLDKVTNKLNFSVYFKETNTFSYLLTDSNHPNYIFKNLPKSLFIRLRRICTELNDYMYFSSILTFHLVSRGYDYIHINKVFSMVMSLDRRDVLEYKVRDNFKVRDTIYFRNVYNKNILNFNEIIKNAFNSFKSENSRFECLKIKVLNSMNCNLASLFIHDFSFKTLFKNFFKNCMNLYCSTCTFFSKDYFIQLTENFFIPIFDNSSCDSENCVYCIKCNLCNAFYIGQTSNIKRRVYHHIYDIKKFKKFEKNTDKCVAVHFNLKGHRFYRDISFYIIKKDIVPEQRRLMYEAFFILLFLKLNLNLINDYKTPVLKAYNHKYYLES